MIDSSAHSRSVTAPALCVLGLVLVSACDSAAPPEQEAEAAMRFLNQAPGVAYVGQEACRDCHLEEAGTFAHTGMGRAFYPMVPEEVVEDWQVDNEFVDPASGLHYRMEQREGKFFQRQFVLDSQGREIAADERELIWALGSNHHSRSYVTVRDDKLFQAPVCWYPDAEKWEMCPGYEFENFHFVREIGVGCIHCHNGVMVLEQGERNKYEKPYPHGIGCERCHGPGELHVERWESGETPTGEADPTIVHVRRLPREERIEVCFQCHLGDSKASERVIRHDRPVGSFRPGDKITDVVVPFRFAQPTRYDFGLTAQADRLILSRCYTESGGQIECLTCHNPHVSVYRENRPAQFFRRPCLSCHAEQDCQETLEVRARTEPAADDCVQCHMRTAEPDDQRFTDFTDHWIRRDIDEEKDHRSRWAYEPIFPERLKQMSPGEQAFYRARAGQLMGSRTENVSARTAMWNSARQAFEEAIEKGFDTVDSQFFLGKVLLNLGSNPQAETAFARAVAHDPLHEDAAFALGQALARRGQLPRALEVFRGMLDHDPANTMALAEVGRTLGLLGRHEEALESYDRAIEEEPWKATLYVNKGRVLAALGRFEEAMQAAAEAVRHDADNPAYWEFYEKVHEAAGLIEQAEEGRRVKQHFAEIAGRRDS